MKVELVQHDFKRADSYSLCVSEKSSHPHKLSVVLMRMNLT